MSYKESIAAALTRVITGPLGVAADQLDDLTNFVEVPKDAKMGDFAFPCFRLARVLRKKPNLIADDIMAHLPAEVADWEPPGALIAADAGRADLDHILGAVTHFLTLWRIRAVPMSEYFLKTD